MGPVIDPKQPLPVYVQLKTLLLEEILRGRYGPGERLPTEHELCATYQISRTPVYRALSELAEEGVVLRHRKRGTFVNPHWVRRNPSQGELRVVVPDGPWEEIIAAAAPDGLTLNVARASLEELHQVLVHAVAEGRAPDIAVIDSVWVHEFGSSGFLADLAELSPEWVREQYDPDFLEPFRSANRRDGRLLAVQAEADVAGIWFRRGDLGQSGDPPHTWQELASLGGALRDKGSNAPVTLPGGSRAGETATYCLLALLASNGATVLNPEKVTLHSTAAVECLEFLQDLVRREIVSSEVVAYERERPIRQLAHSQASVAFGGSYDAPALAAAAGMPRERLLEEFGFARVPIGPRPGAATLAGGMVYVVFRQAASPQLATRVLREVVSTDALAEMSRTTWQIASRRSAVERASAGSAFLCATGALLEQAVVRPAAAQYARVSAQLQAMVEAVLTGRLQPEAASARTAELISAITGLPTT